MKFEKKEGDINKEFGFYPESSGETERFLREQRSQLFLNNI